MTKSRCFLSIAVEIFWKCIRIGRVGFSAFYESIVNYTSAGSPSTRVTHFPECSFWRPINWNQNSTNVIFSSCYHMPHKFCHTSVFVPGKRLCCRSDSKDKYIFNIWSLFPLDRTWANHLMRFNVTPWLCSRCNWLILLYTWDLYMIDSGRFDEGSV